MVDGGVAGLQGFSVFKTLNRMGEPKNQGS